MSEPSAPPPYNEAPPSYESLAPQPMHSAPPVRPMTIPRMDIREDISSLADAIQGLSSSLARERTAYTSASTTLSTKFSEISADLDQWKQTLTEKIDETFRMQKVTLQSAYQKEKDRLKRGLDRAKETLEASDKMTHVAKHMRRTGNQRDLQNLKDNMTENIDALNTLLDQTTELKRTCAGLWSYSKPNLAPESISYLMGKLEVRSFDMPELSSAGNNSSDQRDSPMRRPSDLSTVDNLMAQINSAQIEEKYMLMHTFSSKTFNDKARCHPMAFTLDWMGNVVVADKYNAKVKVFTERGQLVQEISSQYLRSPSGITMTPEGNIAVSDSQMSDVKVFNSQGDLLFYYQRAMTPAGITFNKQGELLVADTGMKAVLVYDNRNWSHPRRMLRDVTLPGNIGNRGAMCYPHYVTVNALDDIFISDRTANSLHVLDRDGRCVKGFGERYEFSKRFNEPYGVTVDKTGNILVADYGSNTVVTIGDDNNFKAPILNKRNDLKFPTNIVVSSTGKLLVSEYLSGDIKVFGTQEMIDEMTGEESAELPPAYDDLGATALTVPSAPYVAHSAPQYSPYEETNPETSI